MTPPQPSRISPAWVLMGILLAAVNLRTAVTSLTPLLDQLAATFGFGAVLMGVFGMLPTAAFALFGVMTPRVAQRMGLERAILLAMALTAVGLLARALAGGVAGLLIGSIVALAGGGIGNVVLPPLVKRYFPQRIGGVSALYITVLQIGTAIPAFTAVPIAQAVGWRASLGLWAALGVFAAVPWLWLITAHRRALARAPHITAPAVPTSTAPAAVRARLPVWRSTLAWGMALMFGVTSLITYALFTWLPSYLVQVGTTPAQAGVLLGVFSALGLVGALGMPLVAVRLRNPFALVVLCALLYSGGFAGLLWSPLHPTLLWVILLGLGGNTFPLSLTLINLRTRGAAGSAALSGFMQGVGYALSCLGPLLLGVLRDLTGGWNVPLAFLWSCVILMLIGGWQACKPRALEDERVR
ncbi:MFS transporter [Sinimarinibacterium sp. NLF-5-8]|uniref:CynX/NimT family MFS transporter n=1 Tax=Sinimarinibacterium sp. NLF-5-8 TaxID=2698684 RepID=UPI00137BC637|nr:MFS transporter [Sinimarinibacterium sp. NLF-5-8]QHS11315.1 MFS transporter [Sinimarinibacterium sp. NLF-5-8]